MLLCLTDLACWRCNFLHYVDVRPQATLVCLSASLLRPQTTRG
jgi:hypothetical protein